MALQDKATKVLYDVSQAIKELDKLNKKVQESEKKAKKAFSTQSVNAYDKRLKKLAYTLGGTDLSAKGLLTTLGGSAAVLGAAAGGVASIAAAVLDLNTILRDTAANFEGFIAAFDRVREARESVSAFGDVAAQRDLEFARRAVKLDQADLAREQNVTEAARDAAKKRLDFIRDELRNREALVKDSLKKEEDLRKKLAERTATDAADKFTGPVGKKALDIGAAARQAAYEGNIELAEELEEAAKAAGEEAGNHALFLKDQSATRDAINASLRKQIGEQEKITSKAEQEVEKYAAIEAALEADIDKQNEKLKVILRQNRELSAQAKLIKEAIKAQGDLEKADTAARGVQARSATLNQFTREGLDSFLENIERRFEKLQQKVFGGAADAEIFDTFASALIKELQPVLELTKRVSAGESVTAEDFKAIQDAIIPANELSAILTKAVQSGRIKGDETKDDVRLLQQVVDQVLELNKEVTSFRRVRGDDTAIREGSAAPTRDDWSKLRDALIENTKAVKGEPSRAQQAAPALDQAALQSQGAQQQVAAAPQTVNVNANVKGGIIDEEVVKTITDLIRRELRKQTTQNIA